MYRVPLIIRELEQRRRRRQRERQKKQEVYVSKPISRFLENGN